MPEIKILEDSTWADFELETDLISPTNLKLKLRPLFKKDALMSLFSLNAEGKIKDPDAELKKTFDRMQKVIIDRVIGWDLTKEGKPLPCDKKNKEKFLSRLLWERVKEKAKEAEEGQDPDDVTPERFAFLWVKIGTFIARPKNFLKN